MSETALALWGRSGPSTSSRTAEGSTEDISSKVCCSCWCGVEVPLAEMREQLPTKGSQASSSCCCRTLGRDTCGDSSVSALISHVEGVCAGPAEQRQEGLIMATSPLLWAGGLEENSPLFSLCRLEVTAGLLWEMAVALVRHKLSSLVWFSSGSSVWDSSVRKLFCSVLGFISRGWTVRKHFLCSGSTRLLLRWMAASLPQGHSKWWMKLKPPKRAEQLWQLSFPTVHWACTQTTEALNHYHIWKYDIDVPETQFYLSYTAQQEIGNNKKHYSYKTSTVKYVEKCTKLKQFYREKRI